MVAFGPDVEVSYPLSDPEDPRHKRLLGYRRRFVSFLIAASKLLREQGEENTVDAIHAVVSIVG